MKIELTDGKIKVIRPTDNKQDKSLHGLTRTLIDNMVKGVNEEFSKTLEIQGIGFRAELKGKKLVIMLGFSRPGRQPTSHGSNRALCRKKTGDCCRKKQYRLCEYNRNHTCLIHP